jgi:NADH-quinone oxidoreductase subunit K
VIVVAAAEAAVALALVLKVYSFYKTSNLNEVDKLGD